MDDNLVNGEIKSTQDYLNIHAGTSGLSIQQALKVIAGLDNSNLVESEDLSSSQLAINTAAETDELSIQEALKVHIADGAAILEKDITASSFHDAARLLSYLVIAPPQG
jgi:hypothetical protein